MVTNTLPDWAQWTQALGPTAASVVTVVVAATVAAIAYRQWRTARDKLILDLFERRYAVFDRAMTGIVLAMRDGDTRQNSAISKVAEARGEAAFLFGDEVGAHLKVVQATLADLGLARTQYDAGNTEQDWPQLSLEASQKLLADYEGGLVKLFSPYMKMTHRLRKPDRQPT